MKKLQIGIIVLLLFLTGCENSDTKLKVGNKAPSFTLSNLNDNTVKFPQDFKGKAVAIRFWADWCPYCETEMDEIEPVYQNYKEQGFTILALNVSQSKERAANFIQKLNISYPVLLDIDSDTAKNYGVVGLPTTFFVDKNGVIQSKILGESDQKVFKKLVDKLF